MASGFDFYVVVKATDPSQIKNQYIFDFGGAPQPVGMKGFYKTILQWVKCLMTEQGTDLSDPSYGTPLAGMLGNNISDPRDASDLVYNSVKLATTKIQTYQSKRPPSAREKLAAVTVTNIVSTNTSIDLYVSLKNAAGEALNLVVPTGVRLPPTTS